MKMNENAKIRIRGVCVCVCVCVERGSDGGGEEGMVTLLEGYLQFLDPRGGSLSLTHVVVLVDFFVSQPTVFIETS